MLPHFHPAPVPWFLLVSYLEPITEARQTKQLPVIGWAYASKQVNGTHEVRETAEVTAWVSYAGHPAEARAVLETIRKELAEQWAHAGLDPRGDIRYELVPA